MKNSGIALLLVDFVVIHDIIYDGVTLQRHSLKERIGESHGCQL